MIEAILIDQLEHVFLPVHVNAFVALNGLRWQSPKSAKTSDSHPRDLMMRLGDAQAISERPFLRPVNLS
jgi:hypothetical protein